MHKKEKKKRIVKFLLGFCVLFFVYYSYKDGLLVKFTKNSLNTFLDEKEIENPKIRVKPHILFRIIKKIFIVFSLSILTIIGLAIGLMVRHHHKLVRQLKRQRGENFEEESGRRIPTRSFMTREEAIAEAIIKEKAKVRARIKKAKIFKNSYYKK